MSSQQPTKKTSGNVLLVDSAPSYIVTSASGYADEQVVLAFIAIIDQWRGRRTGLHAFHDFSGVEDYESNPALRGRMIEWIRAVRPAFEAVHILVERRTVAWGLKIISTLSGASFVSFHHERETFEAALRQAARAR